MVERRDFFIRRISTAVSLARVICFPTLFSAGCGLSCVMFDIVSKSVDFLISRISAAVSLARVICFPTLFSAGCGLSCVMFDIMIKCGDFFIGCISTAVSFARDVFFPTFFGARCGLSGVVFDIMIKRRDFRLRLQYFVAYRTVLACCQSGGCTRCGNFWIFDNCMIIAPFCINNYVLRNILRCIKLFQ